MSQNKAGVRIWNQKPTCTESTAALILAKIRPLYGVWDRQMYKIAVLCTWRSINKAFRHTNRHVTGCVRVIFVWIWEILCICG